MTNLDKSVSLKAPAFEPNLVSIPIVAILPIKQVSATV